MSKTSKRRRENTALVEANWPFPDRKADQAWVDADRAENQASATEQHAKDGNDAG